MVVRGPIAARRSLATASDRVVGQLSIGCDCYQLAACGPSFDADSSKERVGLALCFGAKCCQCPTQKPIG
jgi:hypothetical protein